LLRQVNYFSFPPADHVQPEDHEAATGAVTYLQSGLFLHECQNVSYVVLGFQILSCLPAWESFFLIRKKQEAELARERGSISDGENSCLPVQPCIMAMLSACMNAPLLLQVISLKAT
jgi:hypothetical protein